MAVTFTMSIKAFQGQFLDRAKVKSAVSKDTRAVLAQAGGYTRKTAIRSIRKRKKSAEPGQPPHSHVEQDSQGLRNILFAYDGRFSVVVGPIAFNQHGGGGTVPELMEFGGTSEVRERFLPYTRADARAEFGGFAGEFLRDYGTMSRRTAQKRFAHAPHALAERGVWVPIKRRDFGGKTRTRQAKYAPHPYMLPALQKTVASGKFAQLYARRFAA